MRWLIKRSFFQTLGYQELATIINENGVRVIEVLLAPESRGEWHYHSHISESCYCLKGQLSIDIEGSKAVILRPGEKCKVAAGIRHSVYNETPISCVFLVIQGIGEYDFIKN